jgi:glucosamine kinase
MSEGRASSPALSGRNLSADRQGSDISIFAGVDGGGTKCRVRLRDAEGTLLAETVGGPANIRLGLGLVWENILSALKAALETAGEPLAWERISIGLGLAGIADAADVQRTIAAGPDFGRVDAANDAHTACLGAFSGGNGGILITGTGSAGYGWVDNRPYSVGGWGFELCDDGSAAALGREAIRAALQACDGLAPTTEFTTAVIDRFGEPSDIVRWVTTAKPKDFGALAPLVMQYADIGDPVAADLAGQAAHDLGRYIMRLHMAGCAKVCLVGGMAKPFLPWLAPWTGSVLAEPAHDATEGALLMAHGMPNGFAPQGAAA